METRELEREGDSTWVFATNMNMFVVLLINFGIRRGKMKEAIKMKQCLFSKISILIKSGQIYTYIFTFSKFYFSEHF